MSKEKDPSLYESGFERIEGDRYWTEPWVTSALLRRYDLNEIPGATWEPAAGRGDIVRVLQDHGEDVFASDVNLSELDQSLCDCEEIGFFSGRWDAPPSGVTKIVTNPPYMNGMAQQFLEHALKIEGIQFIAMLLRAEFGHGVTRKHLFDQWPFAAEVKLTKRPRWDWWFRDEPEASPRHWYSWYVFDRRTSKENFAPLSLREHGPQGKKRKKKQ